LRHLAISVHPAVVPLSFFGRFRKRGEIAQLKVLDSLIDFFASFKTPDKSATHAKVDETFSHFF
jgi:hypothetical protein